MKLIKLVINSIIFLLGIPSFILIFPYFRGYISKIVIFINKFLVLDNLLMWPITLIATALITLLLAYLIYICIKKIKPSGEYRLIMLIVYSSFFGTATPFTVFGPILSILSHDNMGFSYLLTLPLSLLMAFVIFRFLSKRIP